MNELFLPSHLAILAREKGYIGYAYAKIDNPSTKIFYPDPMDEINCAQCGKSKYVHSQDAYNKPFFCETYRKISLPLYDQVLRWFREKFGIIIIIQPSFMSINNRFDNLLYDATFVPCTVNGESMCQNLYKLQKDQFVDKFGLFQHGYKKFDEALENNVKLVLESI